MVNDNHEDNYIKEIYAFVHYSSIVNNGKMESSNFHHCRDTVFFHYNLSLIKQRGCKRLWLKRRAGVGKTLAIVGKIPDKLQWPTLEARREHLSLSFFNKTDIGTVSI